MENFNQITKQIQAEAGRYLAWLNSSKPLNDEYKMIKARIVTLACNLRACDQEGSAMIPPSERPENVKKEEIMRATPTEADSIADPRGEDRGGL